MKTYLLLLFGFLLGICTPCFAPWADHEVVRAGDDDQGILSLQSEQQAEGEVIHITLQLNKRANLKHKGYFLLTAKEPFAEDDLEFRSVMMSWSHYLERRELLETWRKKAKGPEEKQSVQERLDQLRGSSPGLANVENIQLLDFDRKGDHQVSMVSLPKEVALRSYLVYDFKPWGGAMVMDGGLWLTYDLPSIIRAQLDSN